MSSFYTRFSHYIYTILIAASLLWMLSSNKVSVAQSEVAIGSIEITEVMYSPRDGGEWVEIINSSGAEIDITGLKIRVGNGDPKDISAVSPTKAQLAPKSAAVIAANAEAFKNAFSEYGSKPLYTAEFSLPEEDNTEISIQRSSDTVSVSSLVYNPSSRSQNTGLSLHLGIDDTLVDAPSTPGEVLVNPIDDTYILISDELSVAAEVEGELGKSVGSYHFVDAGNKVNISLTHATGIPKETTVHIVFGGESGTETKLETTDTNTIHKEYSHTIEEGDVADGDVLYRIKDGGEVIKSGTITDQNGNQVVIDKSKPTAVLQSVDSGSSTRKIITATINDNYPASSAEFKMHTAACADEAAYDAVANTGQKVSVERINGQSTATATIVVHGVANNDKFVCLKVSDLFGQSAVVSSGQITGLIDSLQITEISYSPETNTSDEWIEIINLGTTSITADGFQIMDGSGNNIIARTVTYYDGKTTIEQNEYAVIAADPAAFQKAFPRYRGALFSAPISLTNSGDTVGVRLIDQENSDTITFTDGDGADGDGNTLHFTQDGDSFAASPNPGKAPKKTSQSNQDVTQPKQMSNLFKPVVKVVSFNGNSVDIPSQNLFFTKENSVEVVVEISDNSTNYSVGNIGNYMGEEGVATTYELKSSVDGRVIQGEPSNAGRGKVTIPYTIHFSPDDNPGTESKDGKIILQFAVTDEDGNTSSERSKVAVVRNNAKPALSNATNASVLGFSFVDSENIIVPITVSNIAFGDWILFSYGGTCGQSTLTFAARNGGHGVPYSLLNPRYEGCTVEATDTAGNESVALTLPTIVIGR